VLTGLILGAIHWETPEGVASVSWDPEEEMEGVVTTATSPGSGMGGTSE